MPRTKSKRLKVPNGAGSIRLRSDGRYEARYTTTDPDTGLPIRKSFYARGEAEVRARLIEALSQRERGMLSVGRGRALTLGRWIDQWLAQIRIRPRTWQRYRELLTQHIVPTLGTIPLQRLEPRHVNAVLRSKHTRSSERSGKVLSARTCNHIRAVLRGCLNDALREGKIGRNAAELARALPLDDVRETQALTPDQIAVFLTGIDGERDQNLWIAALALGCRQSELWGLRWGEDVDLDRFELQINRTLQRAKQGWIVQQTKTKKSRRPITLPEIACAAMRRQHKVLAEERLRAEGQWSEEFGSLVFCDKHGYPMIPTEATKRLQAKLQELGLPRIGFRGLRKSTASLLNYMKVPPRVAMDVLGHSQISTTMEIYTDVYPELRREAAEAMNRALGRRSEDGP